MRMIVQGREITQDDIGLIRHLIENNPSQHRTQLSKELCLLWNWRTPNGQIKDMACRTLLLKLEQRGHITLPGKRTPGGGSRKVPVPFAPHKTSPIICSLSDLEPITIQLAEGGDLLNLFQCLFTRYHYLGFNTVGENMKYLVFDREQNPLACLLFGSAAWKCGPRDDFIGWDAEGRKANLKFVTNNMRFLILPWVVVPHLASHILGRVAKRISDDWIKKYGHPIYLLETFVERDRFRGTCYQAANWICAGQTKGRSRNDRHATLKVPVKDIYLYPLVKGFRNVLKQRAGQEASS
ncbi:MAG: Druantia anti-phage system protein DruA [Dehalococcoidia bacterium]